MFYQHLYNLHDVILMMTVAFSALLGAPMLLQSRFSHGPRLHQDLTLASFVLIQGLLALYYLLLYSSFYRPLTVSLTIPFQVVPVAFCFGIQGLLLLWFSRLMAGQQLAVRRSELMTLAIVVLIPVVFRWQVPTDVDYGPRYDGIFLTFPALVTSVYFGVCAMLTIRAHEREIRERYSNLGPVNLVWLWYIAEGFIGVWVIRLCHYLLGIRGYHHMEEVMALASNLPPLVLIAAMVILSLSRGRDQSPTPVVQPESRGGDTKAPDAAAASLKVVNTDLVERLENLMSEVKVYEDPDLDREGLADSLGVSPRTLSACINGHYQLNFYEFVNAYRIEAIKNSLQDPLRANDSIQRLFEEAGFNSKSTFNTLFKKKTGMTPSQYRQRCFETVPVQ